MFNCNFIAFLIFNFFNCFYFYLVYCIFILYILISACSFYQTKFILIILLRFYDSCRLLETLFLQCMCIYTICSILSTALYLLGEMLYCRWSTRRLHDASNMKTHCSGEVCPLNAC